MERLKETKNEFLVSYSRFCLLTLVTLMWLNASDFLQGCVFHVPKTAILICGISSPLAFTGSMDGTLKIWFVILVFLAFNSLFIFFSSGMYKLAFAGLRFFTKYYFFREA